jgi:hypothetical protein
MKIKFIIVLGAIAISHSACNSGGSSNSGSTSETDQTSNNQTANNQTTNHPPVLSKVTSRVPNSGGDSLFFELEGNNLGGDQWKAELRPTNGAAGSKIALSSVSLTDKTARLFVSAGVQLAAGIFELVVSNAYGESSAIVTTLKGDTGAQGPAGPQGAAGIQGPQGSQGPAGIVAPWTKVADVSIDLLKYYNIDSTGVTILAPLPSMLDRSVFNLLKCEFRLLESDYGFNYGDNDIWTVSSFTDGSHRDLLHFDTRNMLNKYYSRGVQPSYSVLGFDQYEIYFAMNFPEIVANNDYALYWNHLLANRPPPRTNTVYFRLQSRCLP